MFDNYGAFSIMNIATKQAMGHQQPNFEGLYIHPSSERYPMPQERWDQLSAWFRDCISGRHSRCCAPLNLEQRYPTRLLDISELGKVRLVETEILEETLPYAIFGDICEDLQISELTAATAMMLLEGVPDNSLSPIYRDAIATVRKFGITYIWIDALCVIQDYPFDIERESSVLADVYAGSILNVSTGHRSESDRLFSPRTQRKISFTLSVGTDMSCQPSQKPNFCIEISLASAWEELMEHGIEKGL
jgi:Heterokaryon incompatibility protein (HET)